ncbi:S8 family serine peptidase [Rothia nasimurium]|uniref:S8 family serine peptidase n=1 Tax=Rothia nasimurium TaxID=85336 RepID=UPI00301575D5
MHSTNRSHRWAATGLLATLLFSTLTPVTATTPTEDPLTAAATQDLVKDTDRLIVTFDETLPVEDRQAVIDRAIETTPVINDADIIKNSVGEDTTVGVIKSDSTLTDAEQDQAIAALEADPAVVAVEPDHLVKAVQSAATVAPSEPLYGTLWNFRVSNVAPAWSTADGSGSTIAIVDTGITKHPDLDGNVVPGYDFISTDEYARDGGGRDSNPTDIGTFSGETPSNWHGTHVAGIAAAAAQGTGLAGVAPRAKIQPVRVLGVNGWGYASDIADGIVWASGGTVPGVPKNPNPATVVNASLAWPETTCPSAMDAAVKGAYSRGVPVVVASGNAGQNANWWTPANCYFAIVVGSTNSANTITRYSNWGEMLDVVAPGGTLYEQVNSTSNAGRTTATTPTFSGLYGTSQAAPMVAGTIALMKQVHPGMTIEQIRNTLKSTGSDASGYRQLNTGAAVAAAKRLAPAPPSPDPAPPAVPQLAPGQIFSDVPPSQLYFPEINWLSTQGITTGWDMGTHKEFRPLNSIERGAMAAFFYRMAGSPAFTAPAKPTFSDVPTDHQFYKEIEWMASKKITTGFADKTFQPEEAVNRDAMAAFFYRMAGSPAFTAPKTSAFVDVTPQDQFYKEISWLSSKKIATGWPDKTFRPVDAINRDAMAAFIYRYKNSVNL